jgi:hypothetical protein
MLEIPASHGAIMAKDGNTYAKRQRETDKKRKAQEKRDRRQKRKDQPDQPDQPVAPVPDDVSVSQP